MAARQPSTSFTDRDASRSHGSMMTQRSEGPESRWLPRDRDTNGPLARLRWGPEPYGGLRWA